MTAPTVKSGVPPWRVALAGGVSAERCTMTELGSTPPRPAARSGAGPHRENWPEVGGPSRPGTSSRSATRGLAALRAAVPTGGRRSKPSPRFLSVGATRSRCAARSGAGLKTGVPIADTIGGANHHPAAH